MSENNGVGVNLIWAVTFLIVVGLIAGALYYSGFLSNAAKGVTEKKVDVKIETPAQ